jgi:predicted AlkP superfamily pyrophosphatase or phosphodiesterase
MIFQMWIRKFGFLASLLSCFLAAPAKAQFDSQKPSPKPLVLLVSLDGFKPEYLSKTGSPHLFELAKNGAQAQGLISAFPSLTFPNHVTLVTGQTPDAHGIVNNVMTDPGIAQRFSPSSRAAIENPAWWQEANPLWVTLRQQGKVASTLFWPGSEAPIQHLMPNDWLRYDHHLSHQSRIDTLMVWLARNEAERPDFATLYFSDVDSAGHSAGPDSAAVRLAVRQVDDAMAHLIVRLKQQGLWSTTTLVIVSDHGMASVLPQNVIQVKSRLSSFPAAHWEWVGPLSGVRLNGESLAGVMLALSDMPHVTCWPKGDLPKRFNYGTHRRIPDVLCLSELGYSLSDNPERVSALGQHGYDPELPDMHGILIVHGTRIQPMQLGLIHSLEIHRLLSQLLGIDLPEDDFQNDAFLQSPICQILDMNSCHNSTIKNR